MSQYESKKTKNSDDFSEVEHRHNNPAAHFECVLINKSIIYVTMYKQKALIYKLSRSKHQNTANLGLQTYPKN